MANLTIVNQFCNTIVLFPAGADLPSELCITECAEGTTRGLKLQKLHEIRKLLQVKVLNVRNIKYHCHFMLHPMLPGSEMNEYTAAIWPSSYKIQNNSISFEGICILCLRIGNIRAIIVSYI